MTTRRVVLKHSPCPEYYEGHIWQKLYLKGQKEYIETVLLVCSMCGNIAEEEEK